MYKAEGIFLFAHGENGELYKKKLNIVDLAITFRGKPEDIQKLYTYDIDEDDLIDGHHIKSKDMQELCYTYNIDENDLIDGKEFLEDVRNKCIIDYDGSLEHIFVNGYESNLGLASSDFCQGEFLVMEDVFEKFCEEYDIKVDFAGR